MKTHEFSKTEQVEELRNQNHVGYLAFAQSLVKWNFSGWKAARGLNSCSNSSGIITDLNNCLKKISINENKCVIAKDIDVFTDNTQKKDNCERVCNNPNWNCYRCCVYQI